MVHYRVLPRDILLIGGSESVCRTQYTAVTQMAILWTSEPCAKIGARLGPLWSLERPDRVDNRISDHEHRPFVRVFLFYKKAQQTDRTRLTSTLFAGKQVYLLCVFSIILMLCRIQD